MCLISTLSLWGCLGVGGPSVWGSSVVWWAQSSGGQVSDPRATVQELNDLSQLVKLSDFGFLLCEMGAITSMSFRLFIKVKRR